MNLIEQEEQFYQSKLLTLSQPVNLAEIMDRTICQDVFTIWGLPARSIDLIFADPPYSLTKNFNGHIFTEMSGREYESWLNSWVSKLPHLLKPNASLYICGDWLSSAMVQQVIEQYFLIQNHITWEREKDGVLKAAIGKFALKVSGFVRKSIKSWLGSHILNKYVTFGYQNLMIIGK